MDYLRAYAISGSGMAVEKARVDLAAANLANANSTRSAGGALYQPLRLITGAAAPDFAGQLAGALRGAEVIGVRPMDVPPRLSYEPGHPDADDKGFVSYPGIQPLAEMMIMITAVRAYEANVAALNAAKAMAMKTLDIGNG
jgi:flagellar basal-body rod protein FlgC